MLGIGEKQTEILFIYQKIVMKLGVAVTYDHNSPTSSTP